MLARKIKVIPSLFIAVGLGVIIYAVYSYLGPDLAFAFHENLNPPFVVSTTSAPEPPQALAPTVQAMPSSTPSATAQPTKAVLRPPFPRGKGLPGTRLVIPRMRLDVKIGNATWTNGTSQGNLYTDWNMPYDAVGHLEHTANPGEAGKVVIAGHNNLVGPNQFGVGLFAGLWDLKPGDVFYIFDSAGRVFEYRVTKSYPLLEEGQPETVRQQHARQVLADDGTAQATLLTCWNGPIAPLSGNSYRWVVESKFVGEVNEEQVPSYGH